MTALFSSPPKPAGPDPTTVALQQKALDDAYAQKQEQDSAKAENQRAVAAGYRGYASLLGPGGFTGPSPTLGGKSLLGGD